MRIIFLSECVLVYIVTMYYVIQFDETGDNSVAVVDENWLTPLKRQVYWPPLKDTRIFRRALAEHQEVDSEIWKVYGVKKIFFQTDDIEKAFRKEKEAQNFSDINDTDENASNRPTKRIIRRVILTDSDDSDEESRYSRPPQIKIKKLSGAIEKRQISRTTAVTPPQNLPSTPKASRASASAQTSITDSNLGTLVNILNTIKEQNKILLEKVGNIENFVFNKGSQVFEICNPIKNPLPVDLPIGKENDLKDVEVFLKENESNFKILVNFLGCIGGNNLKTKIHKILRHLLTNQLASQFSYFGKRGKAPFSELCLNKAIIESLQSKIEGASITEIEDTIKTWMKHAPDRMKIKKVPSE